MNVGEYLLLVLIPLALQTSLFPHLSFFGVIPNLVLITTICYGLLRGIRPGLCLGLLGGACLDLAGGGVLGINITILGLLGLGAGYLERLVFKGYLVIPLCMVLVATVITELFTYSILLAFGWRIELLSFLGATLLPLCLYNLVLTAPVYFGLKKGLDLIDERRLKVGA